MTFTKSIILTAVLSVSCMAAGDSLYKSSCASCHGAKGEKNAMGKSQPIQGMKSAAVIKALDEYASGARKSTLPVAKSVKAKFSSTHTDKDIQDVADYISKL